MLPLLLAVVLSASPPATAAPSSATACRAALKRGVTSLEKAPEAKRLAASLDLLGTACPKELGDLAKASSKARGLPRTDRATLLAKAAGLVAPCATDKPSSAAGPLLRACPPAKLELSTSIGRDLDAGTYLFVVAVSRRLDAAGAFDDAAERVLSVLVLGAALEGEAAR